MRVNSNCQMSRAVGHHNAYVFSLFAIREVLNTLRNSTDRLYRVESDKVL